MSAENIILLTREGWQQLCGGEFAAVAEWPVLDAPTLVVTDFEEAPLASYRFDNGKTAYAVPMIEKRARSEGVIDGLAHIISHRLQAVRSGFQTFHTVVPLEFWQRLQQWATQQRDHCILISLGTLLENDVRPGHARVLRLGRSLHFYSHSSAGFFYVSANAIGGTDADLFAAVRVLAGVARAEIDRGIAGSIEWGSLLTADPEQDMRLIGHWNQTAKLAAFAMPAATWRTATGPVSSVLPALLERLGFRAGLNSPLARVAWLSERLVAGVAGGTAAVALGLFGLSFYVNGEADQKRLVAAASLRQIAPMEARVKAANAMPTPAGFAPVVEFAHKLGDGLRYDPVPMLGLLREASGAGMRIQRLRLETGGSKDRAFVIDGVSDTNGVAGVAYLLSHLRDAGWSAQAVNPQDAAPGAFSYRLTANAVAQN